MQHYAFLVDDELFDRAYARLRHGDIDHWADPQLTRSGETNDEHGGRGVQVLDPAGYGLEMITRPYLYPPSRPVRAAAPRPVPMGISVRARTTLRYNYTDAADVRYS